jgi:uncharacterized protein involved in exopolysaccharide biosynthesis
MAKSECPQSDDEPGRDSPPRRASRRRWPLVLISILLALTGSAIGAVLADKAVPPVYISHGLIGISPVVTQVVFESEQNKVMPLFDAFVSNQIELIRSERVMLHAMEDDDWRTRRSDLTPKHQEQFKDNLKVIRPARANIVKVSFKDTDPEVARKTVRSVINSYMPPGKTRNHR